MNVGLLFLTSDVSDVPKIGLTSSALGGTQQLLLLDGFPGTE